MNKKYKTLILLNILLMFYSASGILSKIAAGESFLSLKFILCYGGMIFILFVYAIGWQQVIKNLPLTMAFANKAVTVVWGIIWGRLFFHERITIGKLVGAAVVIAGVIMYVTADSDDSEKDGLVKLSEVSQGINGNEEVEHE